MQRMTELHQHVVRRVGHVVDGADAHGLQATFQPFGRGLHAHILNQAPAITRAQVRLLDLDRHFIVGWRAGLFHRRVRALQRLAVERREFARHAVVAEAVRAVGGDLEFENPVIARRRHRLRTESQTFEVVLELLRLDPDLDEFAKPVEGNLHRRS